jgi:serine/threonine protein kinase
VKVLDFGIAKILTSAPRGLAPQPLRYPTAEGVTVGTPRCLSPEQARGGQIDARTDVYAVGVLLYSLLVGAGPFDHLRNPVELLHAHVSITPVAPSQRATQRIPPEVDAAVMRALAKRPEDRFASAAEFSIALGRALTLATEEEERARFDTDRAPMRFDTEPLPSSAGAAFEPTLWIPAVPSPAVAQDCGSTMLLARVATQPAALSAPRVAQPLGVGVSLLVVMLSALASASVAAILAWWWLFR